MREIKYRAWQQGIMCKVLAIEWEDGIPKRACFEPLDEHLYKHTDWLRPDGSTEVGPIFLQYTGLKDKNGVEIFEGDLLKNKDSKLISEVTFNDGSFWLQNELFDEVLGKLAHDVQVIGNTYETPELLKGAA